MNKLSTLLVTGVNGFIGSYVAAQLADRYRIVGIGSDSVDRHGRCHAYHQMLLPHGDLEQVMGEEKPLACLHFAGSSSVGHSLAHPGVDFQSGPAAVFQVLDAIRKSAPSCLFLFPSSAAVYGNPGTLPIREDAPLAPISPYGYHKLICEKIIEEFHAIYGLNYLILRIFSCYGAGLRKQLLWDICRKADSGKVSLYGTGQETRDFIHALDVAGMIRLLLEKSVRNEVLNVGGGRETSVREVAESLLRALGCRDLEPEFLNRFRTGDPARWRCDPSRLASLGFSPAMPLDKGIEDYARWYTECGR